MFLEEEDAVFVKRSHPGGSGGYRLGRNEMTTQRARSRPSSNSIFAAATTFSSCLDTLVLRPFSNDRRPAIVLVRNQAATRPPTRPHPGLSPAPCPAVRPRSLPHPVRPGGRPRRRRRWLALALQGGNRLSEHDSAQTSVLCGSQSRLGVVAPSSPRRSAARWTFCSSFHKTPADQSSHRSPLDRRDVP